MKLDVQGHVRACIAYSIVSFSIDHSFIVAKLCIASYILPRHQFNQRVCYISIQRARRSNSKANGSAFLVINYGFVIHEFKLNCMKWTKIK